MKVVINKCFGGFGISPAAWLLYRVRGGTEDYDFQIKRNSPILVSVVEDLGSEKASDKFAELAIVEVPDDIDWYVEEYDGMEHIAELHRTWS